MNTCVRQNWSAIYLVVVSTGSSSKYLLTSFYFFIFISIIINVYIISSLRIVRYYRAMDAVRSHTADKMVKKIKEAS